MAEHDEQRAFDLEAARAAFKQHEGTPGYHTGFADGCAHARAESAATIAELRATLAQREQEIERLRAGCVMHLPGDTCECVLCYEQWPKGGSHPVDPDCPAAPDPGSE